MMETTDKLNCNILVSLLKAHGVKRVIASPGSRNAPLLVAFSRAGVTTDIVIDERSAAFIALGAAIESGEPVAVCCTSGSALLNYAPAVAEAYYRGIPVIIVAADRPAEWIDQDDSQTIRQLDALTGIVKTVIDIPPCLDRDGDRWRAEREINDALAIAMSPRRGPVHINVRIDAPLGQMAEYDPAEPRVIRSSTLSPAVSDDVISLAAEKILTCRKVMIVAGFMSPCHALEEHLNRLSRLDSVAVLTETVANLHGVNFISAIDLALNQVLRADDRQCFQPQLVITIGGALISRKIKEYLRSVASLEHWHIGMSDHLIDCFRHLSMAVNSSAEAFFDGLVKRIGNRRGIESDFRDDWIKAFRSGIKYQEDKIAAEPWTDMKAFYTLLSNLPPASHLHFSNGTPIRYSQLMGYLPFARVDCNRGVSGIDGCTSTALGASIAAPDGVTLITGDMSFQYDVAALSSRLLSPRLKIVVILNSGGGIFRFIESTARLDEREIFFSKCMNLPVKGLAEAYGIQYFHASDSGELLQALPEFLTEKDRPALLVISTPAEESALSLRSYFR